ncbi:MAG: RNA polymerase sigma factor [Xanthomonadales bacterium]|nr:RNA polymerase sigma factor [Xanthomonadales bacterium]
MNEEWNEETGRDELLAIRCQLGEGAAFDELIERYAERLRGYVRRVANSDSDADDLVQDAWLRILRGLPGLRDPARLRAWVFGIAHRVIIDRLRSRYAEPAHAPIEVLVDEADLQAEHLKRDQVERGLAALAPPEREAVVLFYLEQLPLAEMAEVMDVPLGTAKSRLHRARTRLRAVLEDPHAPAGTGAIR